MTPLNATNLSTIVRRDRTGHAFFVRDDRTGKAVIPRTVQVRYIQGTPIIVKDAYIVDAAGNVTPVRPATPDEVTPPEPKSPGAADTPQRPAAGMSRRQVTGDTS